MPRDICRALAVATVILALSSTMGVAVAKPFVRSADERAIIAAVATFWQGWELGDRGRVQSTLAAQYVDFDADGVRREAAEVLAFVEPLPAEQAVTITTQDHRVRFIGGGVAHVDYRVADCRGASERRGCYRFVASDIFVRERNSWKLAAGHQMNQPAAAPDQAEVAKAEVAAAVQAIADAQIVTNVDAFTRLHTDDWRLTHGRGHLVDRSGFTNDMRTAWKPIAIDYSEQTVRLARDSAIVEGVVTFRWKSGQGVTHEAVERHVDIFVRQYGRWRRAASTLSCISGECG